MTELEKREMLQSVLNGAEWEYRAAPDYLNGIGLNNEWHNYEIGLGINDSYEYRRKEIWYVAESLSQKLIVKLKPKANILFKGTKEECEKYVAEHSSWLESKIQTIDTFPTFTIKQHADFYRKGATDLADELLITLGTEGGKGRFGHKDQNNHLEFYLSDIEDVLKYLGVNNKIVIGDIK